MTSKINKREQTLKPQKILENPLYRHQKNSINSIIFNERKNTKICLDEKKMVPPLEENDVCEN